ncbi:hypothetical protein [Streptomyces venezuelae]|uniref:hypothetical protein n=1 Tax=Streptomyces venezuelae TaxID=54571 RepID=UPI00365B6ABE
MVAGAGPIDDLALLSTLLKMSARETVPWASLAARDQRQLVRCASTQSWVHRGDSVERLAVSPIQVDVAVVRSGHARREARDVMPFGAYVPQAIWLDCPADEPEDLLTEASRFGTGVVQWQGRGEPRVLAPAVSKDWCMTAAGWQFDEHAYARVLGVGASIAMFNPLSLPTGLARSGLRPYSWAPDWLNSLAALLLVRGRRAGVDLMCIVMATDLMANWYAAYGIQHSDFFAQPGLQRLTAFTLLVLATRPFVRPRLSLSTI